MLGEGTEVRLPFPIPKPVNLFYLAVPDIFLYDKVPDIFFYDKLVI